MEKSYSIKNVVIVTDCSDVALEQVKAKIISLLPNAFINFFKLITPPFQLKNGLFLTRLISEEIPHGENTLFLAILNPLKSKPKRIFGRLNNGSWFVGADTGIFSLIFEKFGIREVYEAKNQVHYPFGGLHVHSIIAGNLLAGVSMLELGNEISYEDVKTIVPEKGEVIHIDNFGLIKLWNRIEDFNFIEGEKVRIKVSGSEKTFEGVFSNRMMNCEDGTLTVYPGSSLLDLSKKEDIEKYRKSGLIEIGIVRNPNSAKELGIIVGEIINFTRIL